MTAVTAGRQATRADASIYSHLGGGDRYTHERRDEALLALLGKRGIRSLAQLRILELGCGDGSFIRTLVHLGAVADRVGGVDLDATRASVARGACPGAGVSLATAAALPYRDGTFDLVTAFTSLSSMLDDTVRIATAREALRVIRPGGLLIVYDFKVNPTNSSARPLRERELRSLFPEATVDVAHVTLAPPIARLLRGLPAFCRTLERVPLLRTHLMATVVKADQ